MTGRRRDASWTVTYVICAAIGFALGAAFYPAVAVPAAAACGFVVMRYRHHGRGDAA